MNVCWQEVTKHLEDLYSASTGLEAIFPGRKFTLDGHLVGSIGEVVAAYMFDLDLYPASTQGYDARSSDGRNVEIKLTQGDKVALRHEPQHLIVLHRPRRSSVVVVFNGPGHLAWEGAGKMQKNGQKPISISKLLILDALIEKGHRLPLKNEAPI